MSMRLNHGGNVTPIIEEYENDESPTKTSTIYILAQ
jgi:hypothetical protein